MKKVLITGASGFVGQHVQSVLRAHDGCSEVVAVGHSGGGSDADQPRFDLRDVASIKAVVADHQPDAIIHLAGMAAPEDANRRPDLAWAINFDGVRHLAQAILALSPKTRLVFSGSAHAYGGSFDKLDGAPITEEFPLLPKTVYAATKACADMMLGQMAGDGLDCIRFRSFNHSGPRQTPDYVVPDFARQVAQVEQGGGPDVIRTGNTTVKRDFLDVRDVARAYVMAALAEGLSPNPDHVFNLSSGEAVPVRGILETLQDLSPAPVHFEEDPAKIRSHELGMIYGDNSKVQKFLGWAPQIPLRDMVAAVLEDQRRQLVGVSPAC